MAHLKDAHLKDTRSFKSRLSFDQSHIFHPYTTLGQTQPNVLITHADGVYLYTAEGRKLIDAMSSWWSVIHGYNHPILNQALEHQISRVSHVMFGGLTHEPAINLCELLVAISPAPLEKIFLCDSGSVAVEVALKMALQYWIARKQPEKRKFLTFRGGYFGDTLHAMSLADPINGMHNHFKLALPQQVFVEKPRPGFSTPISTSTINSLDQTISQHHHELAGIIVEPIVQGAGGMNFYSPTYLTTLRNLCDRHDLLLIFDEIATGFGRTGQLFATQHAADISPDIMTIGKALTGGYLTLAATLTTTKVSEMLHREPLSVFMHGPTFMANPLACSVALASTQLLLQSNFRESIQNIEQQLETDLTQISDHPHVKDVRTLGGIGVIETTHPIRIAKAQAFAVEQGVWLRPYRNLLYTMPPYIVDRFQLKMVLSVMKQLLEQDIFLDA